MNINLDTWRGLTDAERETLLHAGARATAEVAVGYIRQSRSAMEQMAGHGIEAIAAPADLKAATEAFAGDDMAKIASQFIEVYGVGDAPAKMETISALIEKWKGLYAGVDVTDVDAVSEALWTNVQSRLAPAVHGMN